MDFTHIAFLYVTLALLALLPLGTVAAAWRRRRDLARWGNAGLVQQAQAHLSPARRMAKFAMLLAALWFMTLALAGPQMGSKMVEVRRQGRDVFVALDVSRSMLAEDIKPSRLQRAKLELTGLIDQLKGDRIGVIAFAGSGQIACPLTSDYEAAKLFLGEVSPESVALPGTSLGDAVRLAAESFPKGGEGFRVLVLLTDGEDHRSEPEAAAQAAKAAGIRILAIGFGTPAGEPIPVRDEAGRITGYMKNDRGESVVSRLDENLLRKMTEITNGAYYASVDGALEADKVVALIDQMQKREVSSGKYGAFEDRYQVFLAVSLVLVLLSLWLPLRRRAWVMVWAGLLLAVPSAQADMAGDVNAGNRLYSQKQYPKALQKYQDAQIKAPEETAVQYNLGNAYHRQQKWNEAEQSFRRAAKSRDPKLAAKAWFNLGNTFMAQKKFKEALEPYGQALRRDPKDAEAVHNLALALRYLKQPPSDQQQPSSSDQQQGKQEPKEQGAAQAKPGQGQKAKPTDAQKGPDDRGEERSAETGQAESGTEPGAPLPKPGEMSPQEAENILEAVKEAEREAQRGRRSGIQDRGRGKSAAREDW